MRFAKQVVSKRGSGLIVLVKVEQNYVVSGRPLVGGDSCKPCA